MKWRDPEPVTSNPLSPNLEAPTQSNIAEKWLKQPSLKVSYTSTVPSYDLFEWFAYSVASHQKVLLKIKVHALVCVTLSSKAHFNTHFSQVPRNCCCFFFY